MKSWKNLLYMCVALGMLIYAVPRLSMGGGFTAETAFGVVWICFALLIVAAHFHQLLGVDKESRERMRQVKRMKQYRMQQKVYSRTARYGRQA
jgi:succinate-acetate transporter protein